MTPVRTEAPARRSAVGSAVSACLPMEETSAKAVSPLSVWTPPPPPQSDMSASALLLPDLERCEPGWEKFQGFCYRHFSLRQSWEVAEQHCRKLGAHLVSIMSPEEQDFLNSRTSTRQLWSCLTSTHDACVPLQETTRSTSGPD